MPLCKIKFTPEITPSAIGIYKDRVLIFPETKELLLFVIDSKEVAESFRVQFEVAWNQDTTVSKGFDALREAVNGYMDGLKPGEEYTVLGATFGETGTDMQYAEVFKEIHKRRFELGIKGNILFQQEAQSFVNAYAQYKQYIDKGNTQYKFLPYKSESPVAIFPSEDKTLLVIQRKEPTIIIIRNKDVADSFKKSFETLWNQETKVLKGLDAVENIFNEMLEYGMCDFIAARGYFVDQRPKFIDDWEKRAIKKGFTMRNVVDPETKGHRITKFSFATTKYTLQKEFSNLSVFWIYGDKVVISNWVDKEPTAIIIENKNLYDTYKQQFELLWAK